MKFFHARQTAYHTSPKLIDDVIYTPYMYDPPPANPNNGRQTKMKFKPGPQHQTEDLLGIPELHSGVGEDNTGRNKKKSKFDDVSAGAEIFLFSYGTVVIWGMTEAQEKRFLTSMFVYVTCRCHP